MRATPIIHFLGTPTGTVAMIICSLAIIDSYAAFWIIMLVIEFEIKLLISCLELFLKKKKSCLELFESLINRVQYFAAETSSSR